MYGRPCNGSSPPASFLNSGGEELPVRCWLHAWGELEQRGALLASRCESTEEGRRTVCSASLPTSSVCSTLPPLIHPSSRNRNLSCARQVQLEDFNSSDWSEGSFSRSLHTSFRYFSLLPCEDSLCLLFKNHLFESWVGGVVSLDEGATFLASPQLVLPRYDDRFTRRQWRLPRKLQLGHNYALLQDGGGYLLVGGMHNRHSANLGVWMLRGKSWKWSEEPTLLAPKYKARGMFNPLPLPDGGGGWEGRIILNGSHPGCVERRDASQMRWLLAGVCEFDGRLSLAHHRGEYLLYTRANVYAHGHRFVQLTTSTDSVRWRPFELLQINGYSPLQGDIYFFAVQPNPVHNGSLLAIFPISHQLRGCIAISLSLDGKRWSRVRPLLGCGLRGERTTDHPLAGGVVLGKEGDRVHFWVQHNVPLISVDRAQPAAVSHWLERHPPGASTIMRYSVPCAVLGRWTSAALHELNLTTAQVAVLDENQRYKCERSAEVLAHCS